MVSSAAQALLVLVTAGAPAPEAGADGLKALWAHIVKLSVSGDEKGAAECLFRTAVDEKALAAALGPPGVRLWPAYKTQHIPQMRSKWAPQVNLFVRQRKMTQVEVACIQELGENVRYDEGTTLPVLRPGVKLYRVVLVNPDPKARPNRKRWYYSNFVFVTGRWVFLGPIGPATWKHYPGADGLRAMLGDIHAALADGNTWLAERRILRFALPPEDVKFLVTPWVGALLEARWKKRHEADLQSLTAKLVGALGKPKMQATVVPVGAGEMNPIEKRLANVLRENTDLFRLTVDGAPPLDLSPVAGRFLDAQRKQFLGWRCLTGLAPLLDGLDFTRPAPDWKPAYAADPAGLAKLVADLLEAVDTGRIGMARALFASLEASRDDYQALFGQEACAEMWKYYSHPQMGYWNHAPKHVSKWLTGAIAHKRRHVRVVDIRQRDEDALSRRDRRLVQSVKEDRPLYQVFLLATADEPAPDTDYAQRFFVHRAGRWVWLADAAKFLPRAKSSRSRRRRSR